MPQDPYVTYNFLCFLLYSFISLVVRSLERAQTRGWWRLFHSSAPAGGFPAKRRQRPSRERPRYTRAPRGNRSWTSFRRPGAFRASRAFLVRQALRTRIQVLSRETSATQAGKPVPSIASGCLWVSRSQPLLAEEMKECWRGGFLM